MPTFITSEPLYMFVPYDQKEWAKEKGMKFDGDGKCWFLPPGQDPLPLRQYWSYLEKTYEDRAELKRRGCRYNPNIKKWYVPENLDIDDFTRWWPDDLRHFLLCDRYAIHEKYGPPTGQSNVYRAWDVTENSGFYAVKVYKNESDGISKETQSNIANAEIKSLEKLNNHPNILKISDVDYQENTNQVCLISPWMPGGTLGDYIEVSEEEEIRVLYRAMESCGLDVKEDESTTVKTILEELETEQRDNWLENSDILIGILKGLNYAHSRGIYHRDLKPANVLIDFDLESGASSPIPVLCDFGAAKIRDELSGGNLTDAKYTLVDIRTRAYRWDFGLDSKEGQKERANQHTWDLVSWAVIAVECLANENVDSPGDAVQLLNARVAKDLDPQIVGLLEQAISENPDERPPEIGEFLEKIVDFTERRKQILNWEC